MQRPLARAQGVLGSAPAVPFLPSAIPHPPYTSNPQTGKPGRAAWRRGRVGGTLSSFCRDKRALRQKVRRGRCSRGCGEN